MIKQLINWLKKPTIMADTNMKKFSEQPSEEVLRSLAAYKLQNPVKYEAKKAALFAKYGIEEITEQVEQEVAEEIKVKKSKKLNIV